MADTMEPGTLAACPFCQRPLFVRTGANAYGRCDTEGCWMHERKLMVPLGTSQVDEWNTRATDKAWLDELFNAIQHGDDDHRAWLKEAIHAFADGRPVPDARGLGRKEATDKALREAREALEPFAREAGQWDDSSAGRTRPMIDSHEGGGVEAEFTVGDLRRARQALAHLDTLLGEGGRG